MRDVQLVVDTDVVSYMFKGGALGAMFSDLIGASKRAEAPIYEDHVM